MEDTAPIATIDCPYCSEPINTKHHKSRTFGLSLQIVAMALAVCSSVFSANAEPKRLSGLTKMDRLDIEYQFSPGVQWCVERMTFAFAMYNTDPTIDIDVDAGIITLEMAEEKQTVICEPRGIRFIKDGIEEQFTKFPG
jgi:hypothetical protein